jgi:hypothetical protein
MVYKCSAFGCTSGYDSTKNVSKGDNIKVMFHRFPLKNEALCNKWKQANPRKNFEPSANSRLCSLHFVDDDFIMEALTRIRHGVRTGHQMSYNYDV